MPYKYELHCHTGETSTCADAPVAETIKKYRKKGYDGIVITDHYSDLTFPPYEYFNAEKCAERFLKGYRRALKEAGEDFTVLLGMEVRFSFTANDYLIYGVTESFVKNTKGLLFSNLKKLSAIVRENNMLIVQAHPFRGYVGRGNPKYLDGAEVFNGKSKKPEENENSLLWAKKNNFKILTSGTDFHHLNSNITGGIETQEKIKTNDDLLKILISGEYRLIKE